MVMMMKKLRLAPQNTGLRRQHAGSELRGSRLHGIHGSRCRFANRTLFFSALHLLGSALVWMHVLRQAIFRAGLRQRLPVALFVIACMGDMGVIERAGRVGTLLVEGRVLLLVVRGPIILLFRMRFDGCTTA